MRLVMVLPVVGVVQPPLTLRQNADEVAEIFEVPLTFLLDPANHLRHTQQSYGRLRSYFAIQYQDYYIRGVTAGLLVNFHRHVMGSLDKQSSAVGGSTRKEAAWR